MSWPDPARTEESAEDRELRTELRLLLGLSPANPNFFEAQPTPQLIALAESLRREAQRRRHTLRRHPAWMLMAAALPAALLLSGFGAWGMHQHRRAERLAAAVAQKEAEVHRMALASASERARERETQKVATAPQSAETQRAARRRPKELVIPVQPLTTPANEAVQVKAK